LHELIRESAAGGRTVFFSTHLLDQAERLCSQIAILYKGELAAIGELESLRERAASEGSLEEIFFAVTSEAAPSAPAHGDDEEPQAP
jgi:ABC-2 type transport system ATP-binding protein